MSTSSDIPGNALIFGKINMFCKYEKKNKWLASEVN